MGTLFEVKKLEPKKKDTNKIKLKKGDTISSLVDMAKKLVEEKLKNYKDTSRCLTDIEDLKKFYDETPDGAEIGVDTETMGLNFYSDKIVGMSLCNGKECLYIPINHIDYMIEVRLKNQIPEDVLKNFFIELHKKRKFKYIFHNAKFDLGVFRTFLGENWQAPYWDTMIGAQLLRQDEDHGLKFLYNKYVAEEDEGVAKFDTLFKGITFNYIPLSIATIYAGKDAFVTYELYKYQQKVFNEPDKAGLKYVMENIEVPLMPILNDMNRWGISMNMGMLKNLQEKYGTKLEIAKKEVYDIIDQYEKQITNYKISHPEAKLDNPISISSPAQLGTLLYNILGYKTKAGKGTGVDELKEMDKPLTKALLEYRKLEKMMDAFLYALPRQIEPSDGKIHTTLNQYGAATGRFASSGPNLQQIPSRGEGKEIRRLFGASPGYILMSSDFSQQEPLEIGVP